jgi:hypothetical protein
MKLFGTEHGVHFSYADDSIFCMDFNPNNERYPEKLVQSCFDREVRYLTRVSYYNWAPQDVNIDYINRKIYFKWYGNTCETKLPADWKNQLETIARDLHHLRIYKPSFYPKYFYIDNKDQIHAFTFYSASDYAEQPIDMDFYKPILNEDRLKIVEQLCVDGRLDMKLLVERAFNSYINWPEGALADIYKKVYG